MHSRERLTCVLQHGIPDRVPIVETDIATSVYKALMPEADDQNAFMSKYLDMVVARAAYDETPIDALHFRNEYGIVYKRLDDPDMVHHSVAPALDIMDGDAYLTHPLPDPDAPIRFQWLDSVVAKYKSAKMVAYDLRCCLLWATEMLGFETFMINFMEEPERVGALLNRIADVNIALARNAVWHGADIIFETDDYAYNSGPFFSPALFRRYIFPNLKRLVDAVHAEGGYVIKHTDGNIMSLLPDMMETGIDGIQSLDPLAGMDIAETKRLCGNRLTLWGNVDCGNLMSNGTTQQVREAVIDCMRKGKPGGGYCLCSSNSILSTTRPENYRTMLETAYAYADYGESAPQEPRNAQDKILCK